MLWASLPLVVQFGGISLLNTEKVESSYLTEKQEQRQTEFL